MGIHSQIAKKYKRREHRFSCLCIRCSSVSEAERPGSSEQNILATFVSWCHETKWWSRPIDNPVSPPTFSSFSQNEVVLKAVSSDTLGKLVTISYGMVVCTRVRLPPAPQDKKKFTFFRKKVPQKFGNTKKNIYLCTVKQNK